MNVAILSLVYPPDNVSTAHIVGALARVFVDQGHSVTVLSTTPHYHPPEDLHSRANGCPVVGPLVHRVDNSGLREYRVWMPPKPSGLLAKGLSWLWFHLATTALGLFVARRCDVILTPSPPLTNGLSAWIMGGVRRIPYVYNVQEVYPDVAVTLEAIRNRLVIRALHGLERFVYSKAAIVTVIGSGMRQNLLTKGVAPEKVVRIPNFVELDTLPVKTRDNSFSREHGLTAKFVVSYAGNIGTPQGLSVVLDAADRLRTAADVIFLLVGDGSARAALEAEAKRRCLPNVRFLPFQPFDRVPDIYAASDACIVPQAQGTGMQGLPSKTYRIMACGRPILAICDSDSEVAHLIHEARCGVVVGPSDAASLATAIASARDNREGWNKIGEQGRSFVAEGYSLQKVADAYLKVFARIQAGPNGGVDKIVRPHSHAD